MNFPYHFKVFIKNFIEVSIFSMSFCKYHRKIKTYCSKVKPTNKYWFIIFISRSHSATLIPWRKESSTSHWTDHSAILLVYISNIASRLKAQPVRIHSFHTTLYGSIVNFSALFLWTMYSTII